MWWSRLFFVSAIIVLTAFWFFFRMSAPQDLLPAVSNLPKAVEEIKKEISLPPPLRVEREAPAAVLTRAGVITWTNAQRKQNGFASLKENQKLNQAAAFKLADMFQNQYFAHESPSGEGVADLVKSARYEFISVGENLALGNFESDKALVEAWMNSHGHRANILGRSFQEIGVAVGKGKFEGRETWLAVQHFAKPLSSCPQQDQNLKIGIESAEKQIDDLSIAANRLRAEIESLEPQNRKELAEYNRHVDEHNSLAKQINTLIESTKLLIDTYNSQVRALNQCISG